MIYNKYGMKDRLQNQFEYILLTAMLDGLKGEEIWEMFSDAMKVSKEEAQSVKRNTDTR